MTLKKVSSVCWGAAKTTSDLNIIVMDWMKQTLHQWALHYALFGAICTSFPALMHGKMIHTAAAGMCWTLAGAGFRDEITDKRIFKDHIKNHLVRMWNWTAIQGGQWMPSCKVQHSIATKGKGEQNTTFLTEIF